LNGRIFEGRNGNIIFVPAAGYCDASNIEYAGSFCYLWSSSLYLDYPVDAYDLYFYSDVIRISNDYRYDVNSVRPVINLR
jgi:hypothetical protein